MLSLIIADENKFLVERRRWDEGVVPGIVFLPARHVKSGESLEDALKREMREKLTIQVKETKHVCRNFTWAAIERDSTPTATSSPNTKGRFSAKQL